jgi:hypothetical protein
MDAYKGKIKNKGPQKVEAAYKTPAAKAPIVKKGKDLRVKA